MIALDGSITGFEIRVPENNKGNFKFLSKTKGFADNPEKCLSKINNPTNANNAIICARLQRWVCCLSALERY